MMNKISESWNRIEKGVSDAGASEDLSGLLEEIQTVRGVLKKMCQVSVTRVSLKNAVREALLPVIQEHRDELFPEIVELRRRLEAAGEDSAVLDAFRGEGQPAAVSEEFAGRLEEVEKRIHRLSQLEARFESNVTHLDERLSENLKKAEGRHEARIESLKRDVGGRFESGLREADERVRSVREDLSRLEATLPETASAAAGEVESRLRKEIDSMVAEITGKLTEVQEILRRIEGIVPPREVVESLDERLARLEGAFQTVSGQVGNIDSFTPELRAMSERFANLRQEIESVRGSLGGATAEVRDALGQRLEELQRVLREGISRWESDQSDVQGRLTRLRDALRDQLGGLSAQVKGAESSLWKKISRKEAGLKLSHESYEELSQKIEGIIEGLEAVIAKRKAES